MEAWNKRDPDALASLFDSHAEFVNVTGLWWHDRDSIRKAHAYELERIFKESTLAIDEIRVKQLSDHAANVHAAMTLSDQTAIAPIRALWSLGVRAGPSLLPEAVPPSAYTLCVSTV